MLAQMSFTPTESKKLIAKAVARMDVVKKALDGGMVALHPSSSTYFVVEEITGQAPSSDVWVCGIVSPKGTCVEMGSLLGAKTVGDPGTDKDSKKRSPARTPDAFPHTWLIKDGSYSTGQPLGSILNDMKFGDVYVKGVNALDPNGNTGILWGNVLEGGTFGKVMVASRRNGFTLILPVGLEKLIPVSIEEAAKAANRHGYDYCMGIPCGVYPAKGTGVTEIDAIKILSGATAVPISAGGLGGAEGSITLVVKGDKSQVEKAVACGEASKGAKLPEVRVYDCSECTAAICDFPLKDKPWTLP